MYEPMTSDSTANPGMEREVKGLAQLMPPTPWSTTKYVDVGSSLAEAATPQ
jgi:hypothetical protein